MYVNVIGSMSRYSTQYGLTFRLEVNADGSIPSGIAAFPLSLLVLIQITSCASEP